MSKKQRAKDSSNVAGVVQTVADLRPDPNNARRHTPRNVGMIVSALHEVGAARSIVIDEDGVILAGNATAEAAAEVGITKLHVVDADGETIVAVRRKGLSPQQKARLALYDNRAGEMATWEPEVVARLAREGMTWGIFATDDLDAIARADREQEGDQVQEVDAPQTVSVKPGDVWILGQHVVACGDSRDQAVVRQVMGTDRADCVFTSPPYGVGLNYENGVADSFQNLRELLPQMAESWRGVVRAGGFAVVNFGDIVSGREAAKADEVCEYPMALEYWPAFRAAGWSLWSRRIWCKPGAGVGLSHCMSSNRAAKNWEHVWTWKAPGRPIVRRQIGGDFPSQSGWFDTSHEQGPWKSVHPAGMPLSVALRAVTWHSHPHGVVFEPFLGAGTTLVACEQLSRRCRAVELNPAYVQLSIDRWERLTGHKAERRSFGGGSDAGASETEGPRE